MIIEPSSHWYEEPWQLPIPNETFLMRDRALSFIMSSDNQTKAKLPDGSVWIYMGLAPNNPSLQDNNVKGWRLEQNGSKWEHHNMELWFPGKSNLFRLENIPELSQQRKQELIKLVEMSDDECDEYLNKCPFFENEYSKKNTQTNFLDRI